jgi:hypothetical protein
MPRSILRAGRRARPRTGQRARATSIAALFLVLLLCAAPAGAAPKDARATDLADAAMNDFEAERFEKAVAGLEKALKLCKWGCSEPVRARLHRDLGVVYITGLGDRKRGREQFSKALALEPRIELDSALITPAVAGAFQRARWEGDTGNKKRSAGARRIEHKTPKAAQHNTPLPIYLRLSAKADAKTVKLHYTWGSRPWMVLRMKRMQKGYGAQIPCADVRAGETLEYYAEARDADGADVAQLGSKQEPLQVDVERRLSRKPPSFPGERPPERCEGDEAEAEADAEPGSCKRDADCAPGRCEEERCVAETAGPKFFFVGLHLIQDAALVSGTDVCSQSSQRNAGFSCFRADGSQYLGTPQPGMRNVIAGELTLATTRIALGADLKLADQVTLGLRVGYAILGGAPRVSGGKPFLPFHAEARAAYWLSSAYATSVAPFLFAAGGLAQVDAKNTVTVVEDQSVPPPPNQLNPASQDLDAYKKVGLLFAGAGMGVYVPFGSAHGLTTELRFLFLFPDTGFVSGAALGYALGL